MSDYTVGDTLYFMFTTRRFTTGAPFTLAGTPAISVYEDASTTEITAGVTLGVDHDARTGLNLATIVASGANGYESGKDYHLVITAGTVDSVSVVGEVVGRFTLSRSAAAVDLANGTDGLGVIAGRLPTALVSGRMDSSTGAMAAGVLTATAIAADAITAAKVADGTIDAATFAAGAIDAAAIAANAIDAATFAADVDAEIAGMIWNAATASFGGAGTYGQAVEDVLADTGTDGVVVAAASKTGYSLTAVTGLGNQTANITGNLSGSVGSVSGAVGSVTGAVGSVTGNVGGNVAGSVGSVTGLAASDVGDIKAKTDSLTFTIAGNVDANIQRINDVAIVGDGSGTPFGV